MAPNRFAELWALGYRTLLPIIPPGACLAPESSILPTSIGKVPGLRGADGLWSGMKWHQHVTTEIDCQRWYRMDAGVGIRTGLQPDGTALATIDADTLDVDKARRIHALIRRAFGEVPLRIGQSPKALYVLRLAKPVSYRRVLLGAERVEVLSEGRQFVAEGIHPRTGSAYQWRVPLPPFDQLPVFEPDSL